MEQKVKLIMIKFERVKKVFGDNAPALDDINLEIQPGEFVSIIGHSGAGKSTLLKLIYAEENLGILQGLMTIGPINSIL